MGAALADFGAFVISAKSEEFEKGFLFAIERI
jgi:translation elongation factor EF-1alpha